MQPPVTSPNTTKTPDERTQEWVAVEGGQEGSSAEGLMVSAYIGMWAILMFFVFLGWRRQQQLNTRLAALEAALSKRSPSGSEHAA